MNESLNVSLQESLDVTLQESLDESLDESLEASREVSRKESPAESLKESLLSKWCDQAWLFVIYLMGVILAVVVIINWSAWDIPRRLIFMLATIVPLHVFEENTFPGGFYFMNNLGQKSSAPMVYPQNRLTNMITNLGAEILFIVFALLTPIMGNIVVVIVILFGIGETVMHARDGFIMYGRYKEIGKSTFYGPGTVTAFGLFGLSVFGCYWLATNGVALTDVLLGIGIVVLIIVCLILLPFAISKRVRSQRYAFPNKGYFEKYENRFILTKYSSLEPNIY